MPTDQEADARVRAGALPGGLVRPLGAKASGSEGVWLVLKQLQGDRCAQC